MSRCHQGWQGIGEYVLLVPSLIMALCILRMFMHAALITDKCSRVPSVINSLSFGQGSEHDRQSIVNYIVSSRAGFYICEHNSQVNYKRVWG